MKNLTADRLRELYDYNPETGQFRYGALKRRGVRNGEIAGAVTGPGYVLIGVDGCRYYAHRLAWLYKTGAWPHGEVDHIDGNTLNNAFFNLRCVDKSVNGQNRRRLLRNTESGLLGVQKNGSGWMARINMRNRVVYLGTFRDPNDAHEAYLKAKRELHEGCTV